MTTQSADTLLCHQQSWILLTIIVNMSKQKHIGYDLKNQAMWWTVFPLD